MTSHERKRLAREVAAHYECSYDAADRLLAAVALMVVSDEATAIMLSGLGRDRVMAIIAADPASHGKG